MHSVKAITKTNENNGRTDGHTNNININDNNNNNGSNSAMKRIGINS